MTTLQSVLDNMTKVSPPHFPPISNIFDKYLCPLFTVYLQPRKLLQSKIRSVRTRHSLFNQYYWSHCIVQQEMGDTLIIIFIAETEPDYVYQISSEVQKQFQEHLGKY